MRFKIEMLLKKWFGSIRYIVAHPATLLPKLPAFLVFVSITILSFETVDLFYKIITLVAVNQSATIKNTVSSKPISDNASQGHIQDYSVITARNLLQSTLKTISEKQLEGGLFGAQQELPMFDLKGTIAGGDSFGFIIIEEKGKNKQRLYRLGDMIEQARLVRITRNTATIKSGDREITIKIKGTPESGSLNSTQQGNMTSFGNGPRRWGKGQAPPLNMRMPNSGMPLSRGEVNENLLDLKTIMTQAAVRPYLVAGVQEGFIISEIKPDSLYLKMGLQNGDIIIDLNGKRMQSADDIMQMANIMQSGGNIALNLKRNGKTETFNYSF